MDVSLFDYHLPEDRIAQHPPAVRTASRMLVVDRHAPAGLQDKGFTDLPGYLSPGDLLVLNDTRVIPARLVGRRASGGRAEVLLLRQVAGDEWEALVKPGAKLRPGAQCAFGDDELRVEVLTAGEHGLRTVRLAHEGDLPALLDRLGETPLPPYIRRAAPEREDRERYQTVYAREPGAVAAPTAGLHFDHATLAALREMGVETATVTLHVGLGTFRPVSAHTVEQHEMHEEWCSVPESAAAAIAATRERSGRVIAVGTTVVRALESQADGTGGVRPGTGLTRLFIYPGFTFGVVDALLTNFHLPRSTLLMMVSAFAGRERILDAYRHAVEHGYRFFSYGDCMLIL